MARTILAAVLGAGLLSVSALSHAQVQAAGAPAEGVDVQYRYSSPSDSRSVLQAAPPEAQAQTGAPAGEAAQPAIEGEVGPLINTHISGVSEGQPEEEVWLDANQVYAGVIPGERDNLPHLARTQRHGAEGGDNTLTWIGFQPFPDHTRVFLQTGRAAEYQVVDGPDGLTVTVRLRSTRIEVSNFRRWLDASYFGRAVNRIEATRAGDGVTEVTIELSRAVAYTVEGAGNYLYLDFEE